MRAAIVRLTLLFLLLLAAKVITAVLSSNL